MTRKQITNSVELSPSREAASCAVAQYYIDPGGSLSCLQKPSTGAHSEPDHYLSN
jgi:hypothetical protein